MEWRLPGLSQQFRQQRFTRGKDGCRSHQITEAKNSWGLLPVILGSCLFAPIIEECLYRFFVFEILGKNNPFSYLLSYFTFILAHWQIRGENFAALFIQYSVATIGFI